MQGRQNRARIRIETIFSSGLTDLPNSLSSDFAEVRLARRRNLSG